MFQSSEDNLHPEKGFTLDPTTVVLSPPLPVSVILGSIGDVTRLGTARGGGWGRDYPKHITEDENYD